MSRVILVPGHSRDRQGAGAPPWTEYGLHVHTCAAAMGALVDCGIDARVLHRSDTIWGYQAKMRDLVRRCNALSPACVVELHYNAGPVGVGRTFGLVWPSSRRARELAQALSGPVAEVLNCRATDPIGQRESAADVPLYILRDTHSPACILETHHVDDLDAHERATDDPGAVGQAVARGILAWLNHQT